MSISGMVGFVLGDYFLFASYPLIGSRVAMLVMSTAPLLTAIFGKFFLGEKMEVLKVIGMMLVISGISLTIFSRQNGGNFKLNHSSKGLIFALLGAIGQAGGLILSKYGMGDFNAFAATQIRIISGIVGFAFIISVSRNWHLVTSTFKNAPAMKGIITGSVFGPFLGVSFSLVAIQLTTTGVAATIMSMVPVIIIPASVYFFKQKVSIKEVIGAIISVIGVSLLFV